MTMMPLRRALAVGALAIVVASAGALTVAARRISAEQAAYVASTSDGGRCEPTTLNRSAVLPGTRLAVSPLPDSFDASPEAQISMLGAPASAIARVRVSGSQSGPHPGRLLAYSQGDGASFLPSRAFLPGETVTVHGRVKVGAVEQPFAYHFVVARREPVDYEASSVALPRDYNEMQHFHSRPELEPPAVVVTAHSAQSALGDLLAAPYNGPGPSGPMIFEEDGELVWFHPLPEGISATNLQVQQYDGHPVLTWWQGRIPPQGFGQGEEILYNGAYREIGHVHAGNG